VAEATIHAQSIDASDVVTIIFSGAAMMVVAAISIVLFIRFVSWATRREFPIDHMERSDRPPSDRYDAQTIYTCEALKLKNITAIGAFCCDDCHTNPETLHLVRVQAADQEFLAEVCCRIYENLLTTGRCAAVTME
jgi:hypothetical protein